MNDLVERFPEINPNNYNHDDVVALNLWAIEAASALEASGRENKRFRNGFDNLLKALDEAPGLPLELLSKDDLEKWTDIITGILKALGPYQATGKPITMWEAITEQGKEG